MHRFRRFSVATVTTGVALLGAAGAASASTPPTDTAEAEMTAGTEPTALEPGAPAAVVVDETGTPVAQIAVVGVDPDWSDHGEFDTPASDSQYVQVVVRVESLSPRGLFEFSDSDFKLQDADGFLFSGEVVETAAQDAADEDVPDEAELAAGEVVEMPVTFEVISGVAPDTMFFSPDWDRLVTVMEFEDDSAPTDVVAPSTTGVAQG